MQVKSLTILTAITGLSFVAAAPAPDGTQTAGPSYSDFPEGILPLDFTAGFDPGSNTLQRRDCPGGDIWSCISIMGQAQSDCQDWC
ncbi:hypothetical protein K4K52_006860 [Colletotrichum sp. SAR 10_76]|nr:hypothetical protein K4K51_007532 [Colletotrichum sp. SAR 10_75]KAI8201930.1 hypothetical protein K4K52_006860 [Colletotrichum sp. SAR 10_76]